ncbi:hypothetical protein DL96DRAFT_1710436 [Flagelloscypha sp. PMI_526]|nr:hypothetical protein DL96DRAFT_1710436 [Flagelloscypha sp. PMI_526]
MPCWRRALLILAFIYSVLASPRNITIDDTFGDGAGNKPNYRPASAWESKDCTGCLIIPDPLKAYQGTWQQATYSPDMGSMSLEINFHGSAVYLYFILANTVPFATTETLCNFTIDGDVVGNFHHVPSSSTDLQYDQAVFSKKGLGLKKNHTVQAVIANQAQSYWIGFDYAVVTDDDTPVETATPTANSSVNTKKSVPVGAIAGGVVGGVVVIAAIVALIFFLRRRSRKNRRPGPLDLTGGDDLADRQPAMSQNGLSTTAFLGHSAADTHSSQQPSMGTSAYANSTSHHAAESVADGASSFYNPYSVASGPSASSEHSSGLARRATVRDARQRELESQVAELRNQLQAVQAGAGAPGQNALSKQREAEEAEKTNLRNQVAEMQNRIHHLEAAQSSPWAQGYSDEPPPGYEPVPPSA